MNEYTPTTGDVRAAYTRAMRHAFIASTGEHIAEFDRWLAEVERAAAEKLEAELEARIEDRDYWYRIATEAKDQRDAALSAIAKVRELLERKSDAGAGFYTEQATEIEALADMYSEEFAKELLGALGSAPSTGEGNE